MNIACCRLTLYLAGSQSLKDKRQVLRSLTSRVRQRFNVSIAEIEEVERWQVAILGLCCVSNSGGHAAELLDQVNRFIEEEVLGRAEVVDCQTEVLTGLP